jgi:hypothetical protein
MLKKWREIVFVFTIVSCNHLFAIDFEYPTHNTALMPYFQEETIRHLRLLQENPDISIPFSFSVYDDASVTYTKEGINQVANTMLSSYIRINKYFILPFNFAALYPIHFNNSVQPEEFEMYFNMLAISGLIFQSRFGMLGAFMGYNYNDSQYNTVETTQYYDEQWGDYYTETKVGYVHGTSHDFKWTIVPLVNTAKFPALGTVVKAIVGYFGLDKTDSVNWSMRLVSQEFNLGSLMFRSIEPYYARENFSLQTKNRLYGLKFNMMLNDTVLMLDIGYRDFFDTKGQWYYDDTFFARLMLSLGNYKPDDWLALSFYMDRKFLLPKIGCVWKTGETQMLGEISYYKNIFSFTIGVNFIY